MALQSQADMGIMGVCHVHLANHGQQIERSLIHLSVSTLAKPDSFESAVRNAVTTAWQTVHVDTITLNLLFLLMWCLSCGEVSSPSTGSAPLCSLC